MKNDNKQFEDQLEARLKENAEEFKTKMAILLHDSESPVLGAMKPEHAVIAVEILQNLKDFKAWAKEQLNQIQIS